MSLQDIDTPRVAERKRCLSTAEAARQLNLSVSTLNKWRLTGDGPRFLKLGRRVAYSQADIDAFTAAQRRGSTAEYAS